MSGVDIPSRSCLVCQQPCRTEGQLCPDCAAAGHRVTDTEVIVQIGIEWPGDDDDYDALVAAAERRNALAAQVAPSRAPGEET